MDGDADGMVDCLDLTAMEAWIGPSRKRKGRASNCVPGPSYRQNGPNENLPPGSEGSAADAETRCSHCGAIENVAVESMRAVASLPLIGDGATRTTAHPSPILHGLRHGFIFSIRNQWAASGDLLYLYH